MVTLLVGNSDGFSEIYDESWQIGISLYISYIVLVIIILGTTFFSVVDAAYHHAKGKKEFGDEFNIMKGYINSHYEFINNDFFLDLFKINFLLIAENELQYLQENISQIAKKIKTSYDDLYLIKRKVINYSIHKDNIDKLKTSMKNCKVRTLINGKWINEDSKLDCLLKNKNL